MLNLSCWGLRKKKNIVIINLVFHLMCPILFNFNNKQIILLIAQIIIIFFFLHFICFKSGLNHSQWKFCYFSDFLKWDYFIRSEYLSKIVLGSKWLTVEHCHTVIEWSLKKSVMLILNGIIRIKLNFVGVINV